MDEADYAPLSALQHYAFCPRQCALIHVERVWTENIHTAEGRLMHEKAHGGTAESRGERRTATGLPLCSAALGISGQADVANCRTVLQRHHRTHPDAATADALRRLSGCLESLRPGLPLDEVRGVEGDAARVYFGVFGGMAGAAGGFSFHGRTRRPPRDEMNCLLSFLYALLANDVRGALESCGLDPAVGFLHRDRPGRPSLALDVMEEFRPYLADRLALTLVNRRQIAPSDFTRTETGAFSLKDEPRKAVLAAWQERKREEVEHPFLKEKMTVGLLWHMQARLLARHVRGDLDAYPPFVIR